MWHDDAAGIENESDMVQAYKLYLFSSPYDGEERVKI